MIPDTQVKPGVDTTHFDWLARALIHYKPDVIVHLGDHWDLPSLSSYDAPGSKAAEGRRIKPDIDAGNEAWLRFWTPVEKEIKKRRRLHKRRWEPECHFLFGNHEDRLTRAINREPKWDGLLSLDSLLTPGFQRHPFKKIVKIDGIRYAHFFPNPHSGKAIGGSIQNRIAKVGGSHIQGHVQGRLYGSAQHPDRQSHAAVIGSFYLHDEEYRDPDVQESEWRGLLVCNEVGHRGEGEFDMMWLSMDYLQRKFG